MANNGIGILFQVAGGGSISGKSGQLIKSQLETLSSNIKLKINIDREHFSSQLGSLKAEIQKQLGTLNVNFHTNQGSSGGNGSGTSGANGENQAYQQLKATLNSIGSLRQKLASQVRSQSQETSELQSQINAKQEEYNRLLEQNKGLLSNDQANSLEQLKQKIDAAAASQERLTAARRQDKLAGAETSYKGLYAQAQQLLTNNNGLIKSNKDAAATAENLRATMGKPFPSDNYEEAVQYNQNLARAVKDASARFGELSQHTDTIGHKFKETFKSKLIQTFAYALIGLAVRALKQVYTNVVEIDSAMTQLRIVTRANDTQMTKFLSNSIKLSKELGASIKDVLASVETFSRLGYGLEDATILSKYATILAKVANVSSDEATKGLTAIIKGYGFDPSDTERIADVLINVGQKYAVSASELMIAYEKAGAALNATNTSFEKSAGLIAAANASVQDASVVGTALKTVSARIRKSKTELDELGETADDVAESFSIYADEIQRITGFSILVEGTTDTYKDLYDIFNGISKTWDKLGDTQKARVAEILGGTRQYQVISSILSNWSDSVDAYSDSLNSAGTSMEAIKTYTDSVNGRMEQLKATLEELSTDLLDSSLLKGITRIVTGVLSLLDDVVKLIDCIGGLNTVLAVTAGLLAVIKAEAIVSFITGIIPAILHFITAVKAAIVQMFTLVKASKAAQASMTGLATAEQLAAVKTAELRMAMLKLVAIVAVIAIVIKALQALDKAWQDSYEAHLEAGKKYEEEANGYAEEIESLTSLQKQLQEARGDKTKLAKIYDELNTKIATSTTLLDGETGAYIAANQQLQDRIQYLKDLEDQARKTAIAEKRAAFNENQATRYGDILGGWLGLTSSSVFMWDWAASDAYGSQMRDMMRGRNKQATWNGQVLDYDAWNQLTEEQQRIWLRMQGFTKESWDEYWQEQVDTALDVFSGVINKYDGYLGKDFITNVVRSLVMHGYDLDEIDNAVSDLEAADGEIESLINDYYTSLANKDAKSSEYYNRIIAKLEDIKKKYPELADQVKTFVGSISKSLTVEDRDALKLRSVYDILSSISGEYDIIVDAMSDMDEYGVLSAKTFESMIKNYPDLIKYLTQTEQGYVLNAQALEQYVTDLINAYTAEAALVAMTAENKEIAIQNLKNLHTALAMLAVSSNKVQSDSSARKKDLQDEKDALKDQLDAYKELIDLRKKLLQQYEDELQYKRELEKKEKRVATLQTQYAISQLDTTAAGRAKTRQLAQDLAEAQEDLDDYTLEHAIDVVTNELDSQYEEYKRWIDGKIDDIEDKIDALGTSNTSDANGVSGAIAAAAASAAQQIADAIATIEITPVVNGGGSGSGGGTTGGGRWMSYQDAANAGYSNIRTEHEFARGGSDKEKYGTYQAYLDAMYDKYVGDNPKLAAIAAAQSYVSSHGMLEGDKNRWGQDPNFLPLLRALIAAGGSINDLHGKTNTVRGNTGVYHSGGIVGDFTNLKSTEMFAKLLKGEFVATPTMMETFMNRTLPAVAGIGGSNEFNAPLISIQCDNVTQESLPKLKDIIEEAVQEIKKQLDGGLSRAGYRKPAKKITI